MSMLIRARAVGPFAMNCHLVVCERTREAIVVDPGDEPDVIAKMIERDGARVTALVGTHGHMDHVSAAEPMRKRLGVPFLLHKADLPWIQMLPRQAMMFGVDVPEVPTVDGPLEDGQILQVGDLRFEVRHTPGHTEGGITLVGEGVAFVGDCVFQGSIGRTDLPGGDYDALMRSIRTRILDLPDETVLHCGHGPKTTVGTERRGNPFLTGRA